jgi:hypothetical protein
VLTWFAVLARVLCRTLAHGRKLSKGKIISINVREIWCAAAAYDFTAWAAGWGCSLLGSLHGALVPGHSSCSTVSAHQCSWYVSAYCSSLLLLLLLRNVCCLLQ